MEVKKRKEVFSKKIKTKIWYEQASQSNPYIADKCCIHGYDINELAGSVSFIDAIYLNIKGELPNTDCKALMNAIFVALSNLGPRHPATRAVMNAAVSKTQVSHLLPIGLCVLSGEYSGATEIEKAVRFIRKNINKPAHTIAMECLEKEMTEKNIIAPGFGQHYSEIDNIACNLAKKLSTFNAANKAMDWATNFSNVLQKHNAGWRITGVAAACFVDLGFTPKASAGLYQLAASPGLLAHGLEMLAKPLTAMPFIDDSDYHYTKK